MKRTLLAFWLMTMAACVSAQVTFTPDPLLDDSENVVIYFHADQGNKALANLPASTLLYAHTGVLTSGSSSDSDWKYGPTWGDNDPKYLMTYVSENLYSLTIGNIRQYYGIPANEKITRLAFVFRNSTGSKVAKTASDGDIFVPVVFTGQELSLTTNLPGTLITPERATVNFTFATTQPADLWLTINGETVAERNNATELQYTYTFTQHGTYTVYGNARTNGEVSSKALSLTYADSSKPMAYPGGVPRQGAWRQADGSVLFCLAAPEKESVILCGSWEDYVVDNSNICYYQDYEGFRYFWKSVEGLSKDEMHMYYYVVDGTRKVSDPYALLILDPSNDKYIPASVYPDLPKFPTGKVPNSVPLAIFKDGLNDYSWTDASFRAPSQDNLVIYELLLRDFTGTEGLAKGNGNLRLALEKLPYLKELGINAIELLPINEFNGNVSWGYNPNFYFAPDKAYGTPDDYKEFINTCHENGIAVILDMVFNQSDGYHPWYRLYPVGQNPFYNLDAPHAYSVLNDWNQGYPLVRRQWADVVKFWLTEYHVDGFRFDLVKGLGDNDSYPNSGDSGTNQYNASRVANMRAIQEAMNEVKPGAYFINENLAGSKEENEMAQTGMLNWANVNNEGCQYAMGIKSNSNLNRMAAAKDSRTWGSTVAYLESHDEERLAYKQIKYGNTAIKNDHTAACRRLGSAAAQMILVPGAHMIWQFSEMGNAQSTKNAEGGNNTDPKTVNWNLLNDPDNRGLYRNYCELIRLRTLNPDLYSKEASFSSRCGATDWTNGRTIFSSTSDKEMITVINPNIDKEITVNVSFASVNQADYAIASKSYATEPSFSVADGTVSVPANSYVVITNNKVLSAEGLASEMEESLLQVWGGNGEISYAGAKGGVKVYDLQGGLAGYASSEEGTLQLPSGIYVLKTAKEARKVIVKP